MTPVPASDFEPRRAYARLRLGIPARLLGFEGEQWVTLLNLSRNGAGVALREPWQVDRGVLRWLEFDAYGEQVWQSGDMLGLHFEELIGTAWLVETRNRGPEVAERFTLEAARRWVNGED